MFQESQSCVLPLDELHHTTVEPPSSPGLVLERASPLGLSPSETAHFNFEAAAPSGAYLGSTCTKKELNLPPHAYQACALPMSYWCELLLLDLLPVTTEPFFPISNWNGQIIRPAFWRKPLHPVRSVSQHREEFLFIDDSRTTLNNTLTTKMKLECSHVEETGFEPAISWIRTKRDTSLRYSSMAGSTRRTLGSLGCALPVARCHCTGATQLSG